MPQCGTSKSKTPRLRAAVPMPSLCAVSHARSVGCAAGTPPSSACAPPTRTWTSISRLRGGATPAATPCESPAQRLAVHACSPAHTTHPLKQLPAGCTERVCEPSPGAEDRCGVLRQRFLLHAIPEVRRRVWLRASGRMTPECAGTATTTSAAASCLRRTSAPRFSCRSSPAAAPSL